LIAFVLGVPDAFACLLLRDDSGHDYPMVAKAPEDQLSSWDGLQRVRPLFAPCRTASYAFLEHVIAMEYSMGHENVIRASDFDRAEDV
jgi:hypothetical protein